MNQADAKGMFAALNEQLGQIAEIRKQARDAGLAIPDDVRQTIANLRAMLLKAGLPQETIDTTPGLEPLPD